MGRNAITTASGDRNQISEILARCTNDPEYRAELMENPSGVLSEMGIRISQQTHLVVAETDSVFSIQRVAGEIVKIVLPTTI